MIIVCSILVGKPKGNRSLRRHKLRWEDIRMILGKRWEVMEWIHLAQDRDQ
jgi:hypothetical protein